MWFLSFRTLNFSILKVDPSFDICHALSFSVRGVKILFSMDRCVVKGEITISSMFS